MWPWEHVAFGYLLYSAGSRLAGREPPGDRTALAVALAAVLPDLVDKPLSWSLGLFPAGYSVAHSALVAPWVLLGAGLLARRHGSPRVGAAFAVGYCSHLAGDVLYPAVEGGGPAFGVVLWPLVEAPAYGTRLGLVGRTLRYLDAYAGTLAALEPGPLLAFEAGLLGAVACLWLLDGLPGFPPAGPRRGR